MRRSMGVAGVGFVALTLLAASATGTALGSTGPPSRVSPRPDLNVDVTRVSADAPDDVWAAGANADIGSLLIMGYDGRRWHVLDPPQGVEEASAIKVFSDTDVWVTSRNLIAHWDGQQWAVNSFGWELTGLAGVAPNDLWAVGYVNRKDRAGRYDTFAMHWDGTRWTQATLPRPGPSTTCLEPEHFAPVLTA